MKFQIDSIEIITVFIISLIRFNIVFSNKNIVNHSSNQTDKVFRVVFIAPEDSNHQQHINSHEDYLFAGRQIQHGWQIEANNEYSFNFFLIIDWESDEKDENNHAKTTIVRKIRRRRNPTDDMELSNLQLYFYFTLDSYSCNDFLEHAHIPLVFEKKNQIRPGLFKTSASISLEHSNQPYYICLSNVWTDAFKIDVTPDSVINKEHIPNFGYLKFHHQGIRSELSILTHASGLSFQWKILIYIFLIILNSTFNGLNIGLMSLSISELELLVKTSDSPKERKYARNILPLRRHGNFLLCSILLSITLTSSVSVLLLDDLIQGFLAGIISTIVLCIFGEIIPQAVCSKYALLIDSHTRKLTYLFMGITCVCSWPLSKLVDWTLGLELPIEYSRDALKYLIRKSIDLEDKQCEIITGALEFKDRHIKDIMVPLDRVFMIAAGEELDFETMVAIYSSGFSRIPVYENTRSNIIGWFHVKDLSLIDSNDKLSVRTLVQLCKHKVAYCHTTDTLTNIFELFRHGSTHLAFVIELVQDRASEVKSCVGIVTMHDIIEALLQFELIDEAMIPVSSKETSSAAFGINYLKKLIDSQNLKPTCNKSSENFGVLVPVISLQTKFILSQILNNIKPFQEEFIDKAILEKIIMNEQNYVHRFIRANEASDCLYLYRYQQPSDYFILLLNGYFLIEAGVDKIELLAKQYDHFGEKALLGDYTTIEEVIENKSPYHPYIPEFSIKVDREQCSETYTFLIISRRIWLSAVKSTYFRRSQIV